MSATTDRLAVILEIHRASADLANAEVQEAQARLDAAIAEEEAAARVATAKAAKDAAEARAQAEAAPVESAPPVALDAQPVNFGVFGQETAAPGPAQASPEELQAAEQAPVATPAAVAHADEVGVDLAEVEGTGVDGKITKADVAAAAEASE